MAVPSAYFITSRNVPDAFAAMQKAGVPNRFTHEFLKQLGFSGSRDRPILAVLKALRFLDESGIPTDRYRRYKNESESKAVLAEGIREAYADVFGIDQTAQDRNATALKGIFARLSDKGDAVNAKMATTFKTLADMADFTAAPAVSSNGSGAGAGADTSAGAAAAVAAEASLDASANGQRQDEQGAGAVMLRHDIHIHLPVSTEIAVYDAIFRSLRENLR